MVIDPHIRAYVDGFCDGGHEILDQLEHALDRGLVDADAVRGWIATIRGRLTQVSTEVPGRVQAVVVANQHGPTGAGSGQPSGDGGPSDR